MNNKHAMYSMFVLVQCIILAIIIHICHKNMDIVVGQEKIKNSVETIEKIVDDLGKFQDIPAKDSGI